MDSIHDSCACAVHDECRDWSGVMIGRLQCLSGVRSGLHMLFLHREAAVTQTDVPNVRDECCDWPRPAVLPHMPLVQKRVRFKQT